MVRFFENTQSENVYFAPAYHFVTGSLPLVTDRFASQKIYTSIAVSVLILTNTLIMCIANWTLGLTDFCWPIFLPNHLKLPDKKAAL